MCLPFLPEVRLVAGDQHIMNLGVGCTGLRMSQGGHGDRSSTKNPRYFGHQGFDRHIHFPTWSLCPLRDSFPSGYHHDCSLRRFIDLRLDATWTDGWSMQEEATFGAGICAAFHSKLLLSQQKQINR